MELHNTQLSLGMELFLGNHMVLLVDKVSLLDMVLFLDMVSHLTAVSRLTTMADNCVLHIGIEHFVGNHSSQHLYYIYIHWDKLFPEYVDFDKPNTIDNRSHS